MFGKYVETKFNVMLSGWLTRSTSDKNLQILEIVRVQPGTIKVQKNVQFFKRDSRSLEAAKAQTPNTSFNGVKVLGDH